MLDEKTVCGAVCPHGVPVEQLFVSSQHPENFVLYVAMLAVALYPSVLPELAAGFLLLDINCQFSKYLHRNFPDLAPAMRCCIGWLHAKAGHNLDCQLQYNAMFEGRLGRCYGEMIEQLWVSSCTLNMAAVFVQSAQVSWHLTLVEQPQLSWLLASSGPHVSCCNSAMLCLPCYRQH